MFGLIYTALVSLGFVGHQVHNAIKEQQCINEGIEKREQGKNFANIYTDYRGGTRSLATGERVRIDNLSEAESEGKDCYMRDIYGNPIRNLSEELRQTSYADAKKSQDPRRTVAKWKRGVRRGMTGREGRPYYSGAEYKDLDNGKIYVSRSIPIPQEISGQICTRCLYYMDIENGLLVRETDSQRSRRESGEYKIPESVTQDFMNYFNQKQSTEGYLGYSKTINGSSEESTLSKIVRLGMFYCNEFECNEP